MLYLDYAKQTEDGYIMNFFANSVEDLEDISEGKEFVTKNGTNYGVPAPQSVVTITNKDGEKTTYLMGEDGNWIPGVVNPTDYYTKKQVDAKLEGKEDKITDINLTETGTTVTYDTTDGITLNSTARLTSNEETHDATMKLELPIVPGKGISIDKKENSESVGISIDGNTTVKLGGIQMYTDVGATGTYIQPGGISVAGTPASIILNDIHDSYYTTIKGYTDPNEDGGRYLDGNVTISLPNKSGILALTSDIPEAGITGVAIINSDAETVGTVSKLFYGSTYNDPRIVPGNWLEVPVPKTKTINNTSILGTGNISLATTGDIAAAITGKQDVITDGTVFDNLNANHMTTKNITLNGVAGVEGYTSIIGFAAQNALGTIYVKNSSSEIFPSIYFDGEGHVAFTENLKKYYRHQILISSNETSLVGMKIRFEFTSSNNTKCNSLAILKQLLGDTFEVSCNGYVEPTIGSGTLCQALFISENAVTYLQNNVVETTVLTKLQYSDTVVEL